MAVRRNSAGKRLELDEFRYAQIDGNNARQLQPSYIPEEEQYEVPEMPERVAPARHPKKHPLDGIDFFLFSVLLAATIVTMLVCFDYLKVQSNITTMEKNIAVLESSIIDTQKANKAAKEELEASVDLSYIYDVATKELGMVQPEKEQIQTYKDNKSDMVRQYSQVPEASEK